MAGVQDGLLKLLDGRSANVVIGGCMDVVDTADILFVACGTFAGGTSHRDLMRLASERSGTRSIGFTPRRLDDASAPCTVSPLTPEDFHRYGFSRECLARFQTMIQLSALTQDEIATVIPMQGSAWQRLVTECLAFGIQVTLTDSALQFIAHEAMALGLGARGLELIVAERCFNLRQELPSRAGSHCAVEVTVDFLRGATPLFWQPGKPCVAPVVWTEPDPAMDRLDANVRRQHRLKALFAQGTFLARPARFSGSGSQARLASFDELTKHFR